ncbi:MAG: sensor histidine kinase [Halobacteria archaeon]|nr:sensor histidine kinase [Halobacteria archaeon]
MNIILGYAEELSESETLTEDERKYAEKIRDVGDRLLETTDKERELVEIISDRSPPEEVDSSDGKVEIRVSDNGPGVPESDVGVLGDEQNIEPLYHGSGLGLWLVNWIVKRSMGEISFEEKEPRGTVVRMCLRDEKTEHPDTDDYS